jgi:hypothetical protein
MIDLNEILQLPLNLQWDKFQKSMGDKSKWDILDFSESSIIELNNKYKTAVAAGYTPLGSIHTDANTNKLRCYLVKVK